MDPYGLKPNEQPGHCYNDKFVGDNGRAHFGNVIAKTVNYYVGPSSDKSFYTSLLLHQVERTSRKRKRTHDAHGYKPYNSQEESLYTVLNRLQRLASFIETPVRDTIARKLAGRIATIVDALRTSGFGCPSHGHTDRQ